MKSYHINLLLLTNYREINKTKKKIDLMVRTPSDKIESKNEKKKDEE